MAGTIFGLPLSQRVDLNGEPSIGWLLYLYQANTSTPVNSYQDTGLTILNPWPLEADSMGMMGVFWLADGFYRARGTNADGSLTYFDMPTIQALGASSGAAPAPVVDSATIFNTGDVLWLDRQGAKTGWVIDNGTTIGSVTSGASQRNNADCQTLFEYLWNTFPNSICPVSGGRGGSSLADWLAPKTITLPDKRGRGIVGGDQMGASASGRFASVPVVSGDINTPGSILGENIHTLVTGEVPAHSHTGTTSSDGDHTHTVPVQVSAAVSGPVGATATVTANNTVTSSNGAHTHTTATNSVGGGGAHNITSLVVVGTWYRKL